MDFSIFKAVHCSSKNSAEDARRFISPFHLIYSCKVFYTLFLCLLSLTANFYVICRPTAGRETVIIKYLSACHTNTCAKDSSYQYSGPAV